MAEWADLIRQAFIARRVIDHHSSHSDHLMGCADPICKMPEGRFHRALRPDKTKPYALGGTRYPWREERDSLEREARRFSASDALRQLAGTSADSLAEESAGERRMLARAFDLLRSVKEGDGEYEKLFLQYLRVKTAVFRLLVHPPGEHGLERFVQYFSQIKVYAPESDKLKPRRPMEPGLDVRATEYRVAPDAWLETLRHDRMIEEQIEGGEETRVAPESGWIIHFKRKGAGKELPLYGAQCRSIQGEAERIRNALAQKPARLKMLRGIDICGVEGRQPLWVSAQTLRWLRTRSQEIAARDLGFSWNR